MEPRRLRILRIDDDLPAEPLSASPSQGLINFVFPHAEFVTVLADERKRVGIRNWHMALQYWKGSEHPEPVDIVVADIRFKDSTNPLASLVRHLSDPAAEMRFWLPTGLSHLKGFAAIARATGSPIGIAVHTAERIIYNDYLSTPEPVLHALALLAAHEIGELAAMLGQGDQIEHDGRKLQSCWEWLEGNTETHWEPAVCKALLNYRRSLRGKSAPPDEWRKLAKWCDEMRREPRPLGECDGGLPLVLGPNLEDRISFCSLFGDVEHQKVGFRFDLEPLPARCFELRKDDEFFLLDEDHLPRIGSLIYELGDLTAAYDEAVRILRTVSSPARDSPPRTGLESLDRNTQRNLPAALAILLMSIRREHEVQKEWVRGYRNYRFDGRTCRFDPDTPATLGASLADLVQSCARAVQRYREETPSESEVREILSERHEGLSKRTFDLLLRLLTSIGWLEKPGDDGLIRMRRPRRGGERARPPNSVVPLVPEEQELLRSLLLDEVYLGSKHHFLAVAFGDREKYEQYYRIGGHGRRKKDLDTNYIGRELARGFGFKAARKKNQDAKEGRALLERLWRGDASWFPGLSEVCRMYIEEELGWTASDAWPLWLRAVVARGKP